MAKNLVNSNKFDYFIIGTITLNTIIYGIHYYKINPTFNRAMLVLEHISALIFNLEIVLKLMADGRYFFWKNYNIFDFLIIVLTDCGIILYWVYPASQIGALPTMLKSFRAGRVLKLIVKRSNLKMLVDTIFYILPSMLNIILFQFSLIFIYSILGMHFFQGVLY